jgi:nucleoside 2-deoxyribosyltransferase
MPRCFVIQPFDGGPFDRRYDDVLAPAIGDAGLEPYRVDQDPSASVLIDDIENNIRASGICLADITLDNPNIWYEVGFAFANEKPVVMICAKPRPTKYPFDVQHRHIILYESSAPSDFVKLRAEITKRLKAQIEKKEAMQSVASLSAVKTPTSGLTEYETAMMVSLMTNRPFDRDGSTASSIRDDMRKAGYTDMATSLSLESLERKALIESNVVETDFGGEVYRAYRLTESGVGWILENKDRFKLSKRDDEPPDEPPNVNDEDIPF